MGHFFPLGNGYGYGSTDLIESGSDQDPKHCIFCIFSTLVTGSSQRNGRIATSSVKDPELLVRLDFTIHLHKVSRLKFGQVH